jgi:hypothetical protein
MAIASSIDLTKASKRWNRLQVGCMIALFFALDNVATGLINGVVFLSKIGKVPEQDYTQYPVPIGLFLIAGYVAKQTWTNSATFTELALGKLRRTFITIAVLSVPFICLGALSLVGVAAGLPSPINGELFAIMFFGFLLALVFAFWNLRVIKFFRTGRLRVCPIHS